MSRVRFNPPATLSFADHVAKEKARLESEHAFLEGINNTAKSMGYQFGGREDTMDILRSIAVEADKWTREKRNGEQQATPDAEMIAIAIKKAARTRMIPCAAVPQAAAPAPGL